MSSPSSIQLPLLESPTGSERQLGSLLISSGNQKISLPLAGVDIAAKVINRVAQVCLKQVFRNNFNEHLEAVYIFPLAAGSAISSFDMKVGDRVIKGVVQERSEARRQYQQAIDDGKRAALMEQERDDVFTVQVGNLPPGEEVTIEISYSERLPFFENGNSELRLPLVVAPRYIPGQQLDRDSVGHGVCPDTNLVPDASRITPPRLADGVDPHTALKLKVEILPEDGAEISDMSCSQHATKTALSQGGLTISLARADERLNRDFVLRWCSSSDNVKTSLITYTAEDGESYGVLSIMPPRRAGYLGAARDIIFVLDRSGSMQGVKMTSAVRACSILLDTLGPQDRYAIAAFDNVVEWMPGQGSNHFVQADTAGIESGEKYLRSVTARGGTEMDTAIKSAFYALSTRHERDGRLPSLVVLTDGEVGNESQILQRIQTEIGDTRLFVVGIDTAVNSGLLKRLASLGGGTAAFVEPGVQLEEALVSIGREIGAPLVTDLQVENLDLTVDRASLSPGRIPDIFAGRASVCFFKLSGSGKLCVKGRLANGKPFEEKVKAQKVEMPSIAQLWAKAHIVDLEDQYRISPGAKPQLKQEIINLAVRHTLLTKFTAFVVVDEAEIVNKKGDLRQIVQPVETPDLWEACDSLAASSFGGASCGSAQGGLGGKTRMKSMMRMTGSMQAQPSMPSQAPAPQSPAAPPQSPGKASGNYGMFDASNQIADSRLQSLRKDSSADEAAQASPWAEQSVAQDAWAAEADGSVNTGMFKRFEASSQNAPAAPAAAEAAPAPEKEEQSKSKARVFKARDISSEAEAGTPDPNAAKILKRSSSLPAEKSQAPNIASKAQDLYQKLHDYVHALTGKKHKSDIIQVGSALTEFFHEFEDAFQAINDGRLPQAVKLEATRLKLLQNLAPLSLGMELPCLQRFLRATAIELIASLKDSTISMVELQTFWKSKQDLFTELKSETEGLLVGKEAAFWDSSV